MLHVFALLTMIKDRLTNEETGGVVIEYGIVVAVIALGLATVGGDLVTSISGWFGRIASEVGSL